MPDGEFRELNIMAFDDKPFYRELIDDEHGTNIYDEAIDRLWQTVQLLEITITAANTHIAFIDLDSELIAFDEEDPKNTPLTVPWPDSAIDGFPVRFPTTPAGRGTG